MIRFFINVLLNIPCVKLVTTQVEFEAKQHIKITQSPFSAKSNFQSPELTSKFKPICGLTRKVSCNLYGIRMYLLKGCSDEVGESFK